jgi:hypothetical protein
MACPKKFTAPVETKLFACTPVGFCGTLVIVGPLPDCIEKGSIGHRKNRLSIGQHIFLL